MTGAFSLQVVIDASEPHELADWWAETLGWQVEPQDESFIRSMIEQGFATESETRTHNGAVVWAKGAAVVPNEGDTAGRPRVLFQLVPEAKTIKNRIHLDIRPPEGSDLGALHQRLQERGATEVSRGAEGPHQWITFADPEGNEFCVDC